MIRLFLFLLLCTAAGCWQSASVQHIVESAGENQLQLERALDHFHSEGNLQKQQATKFLVENMQDHFCYDGDAVTRFDTIFSFLDSLHRNEIKVLTTSPLLQNLWDTLVNKNGRPSPWEAEQSYDIETVNSDLLIKNVDFAYNAWESSLWSKGLSFKEFCEYLLPYRNGTERLESWRDYLFYEFKTFRDTVKAKNRFEAAAQLNGELRKQIALNHTLRNYPFDMNVSQMEKGKRGSCRQLVFYTTNCMRANGIPVAIDFTPCWGDLDRGHEWNVLLKEDGTKFPFNAASADFFDFSKSPYRFSKVYRMSFAKIKKSTPTESEVPSFLIDDHALDVTEEYSKCYDVETRLTKPNTFENKYAVICTYQAKGWSAQDWGKIQGDKVKFHKIGSNIIYIVMYFRGGKYYPATSPFILTKEGKLQYFSDSGETMDLTLDRKYPYFPINKVNATPMIGGKFQLANYADFSDSITIFTVNQLPVKFEQISVSSKNKYRYVRYLTASHQKTNLAELEVYALSGNKEKRLSGKIMGAPIMPPDVGNPFQNAFDGNPETYFFGNPDSVSWAGLDLQQAALISKIRFCPRSDVNFIVAGDNYELCYWNGEKWKAIEQQIAIDQTLKFSRVPKNQIYILHNLSHGTQERIFTYTNGQQIWW